MPSNKTLNDNYGAAYFADDSQHIITANPNDLYHYTTYIGQHDVELQAGDSVYFLSDNKQRAHVVKGPSKISSMHLATVIRGYMSDNKDSDIVKSTHLPYINGCSTKQIFPPVRLGDPTLQMLFIPPHTSEQAHHIHSTVRVVYVLDGHGKSVVGMKNNNTVHEFKPGSIAIFQRMCPHHFETEDSSLTVLPLHIFSSVGNQEHNHPMFNGIYKISQG